MRNISTKCAAEVKTLQMRFCGNDNDDDGLYFNVYNILVSLLQCYTIRTSRTCSLTIGRKDFK